ncbi:MAG: UDP-N-acetylglucosamine 2-epimerase (non-hydrolyzing), partial [Eubacterium sp.]|nr:UDP-N-acetylglucosamine 2-epimerase (non-hydrolyzing) [Eubacterium sp.]
QLINEGKNKTKVFVTGNTVIDALKTTVADNYHNEVLDWAQGSKIILMTAHRRENIGVPMENMFRAALEIVNRNPDVKLIYPMHKNPKVREIAYEILGNHSNIKLIEPLDVYDFHNFMANSYLILTDSGGIQEEAPSLGKPVLVMRETTERPEGVEAGTLKLVGTNEKNIVDETEKLLFDEALYKKMSNIKNPYGDGHASERIVDIIINCFKER